MAYELKQRCPCCHSNGELVFSSCPKCAAVVLVCTEVGTVCAAGSAPEQFSSRILGSYDSDKCKSCQDSAYRQFRDSTAEEIQRLGFTDDQFQFSV